MEDAIAKEMGAGGFAPLLIASPLPGKA